MPYVDDDWEADIARDAQLFAVEPLLSLERGRGNGQIDADLADCDTARVVRRGAHRLAQPLDLFGPGVLQPQRMDPECIRKSVAVRDRASRFTVVHLTGRDHHHRHAGIAGPRDDSVAVRVELPGLEVAMGVDPHWKESRAPLGRASSYR